MTRSSALHLVLKLPDTSYPAEARPRFANPELTETTALAALHAEGSIPVIPVTALGMCSKAPALKSSSSPVPWFSQTGPYSQLINEGRIYGHPDCMGRAAGKALSGQLRIRQPKRRADVGWLPLVASSSLGASLRGSSYFGGPRFPRGNPGRTRARRGEAPFPSEQPPSGWAERDQTGKRASTGKGSNTPCVSGCQGPGLRDGQARGSGAGWGVPVADGGASLGQRTRTQGGLASSTLILARCHLAFDFHGNIL